jgi:ubiquinone/menaquinone biosynthesis C-methylase UbiE
MSFDDSAGTAGHSVPSMLDLVRLSPKRLFPPGGVDLYRQIALLTEMGPGLEVLDVAAGKGVPLEYFAEEFGVTASGVELSPSMVEVAEAWSRQLRAGDRIQFQTGRSDALPYRDEIFDIAIGEIGLANHCDPADAVRELVRVTKPGGFVVLVQLVWKAPVDQERRAVLSEHLGARPLMVVEWRRLLREAGVEEIHVEDWSDEQTAFRPAVVKPFPDFAELFTLGERIGILQKAWKIWGWRGVSSAIARENAVHKLLTNERVLGLDLLRGRKVGGGAVAPVADAGDDVDTAIRVHDDAGPPVEPRDDAQPPTTGAEPGSDETAGLPLFGPGEGDAGGDKDKANTDARKERE